MKLLLKAFAITAFAVGLVACKTTENTAPTPQATQPAVSAPATANKATQCKQLKKQLRNLDRSAPTAQSKVDALEKNMQDLDCGPK